jgi:CheY-like chemotaxis protein
VSGLNLLKEVYNMTSASVKSGVSYYSPQIESNKDHLFLADEIRLKQVLINLINNAIKFTDKGHIEFGYYAEDEFINFYVEDTGTGIAAEYHSLIFERFRQVGSAIAREKGGTGLGLAISKAIVNQMGGDIFVESEPGKGSKFQFKIPLILLQDSDRSIPQDLAEQVGTVLSWEGKTILIAEDEDANFTLLQLFLRNSGCEVLRAKNGREAVEMVNKYPTDVVLMDLKMPVMDGFEATVSIKRQFPNLPVIAQTAFALSNDRIKAVEAGCDNYLSKPISAKTLINTLARYLS